MTTELNRRILIIDDNEDIHEDFQKILGSPERDKGSFQNARSAFLGSTSAEPSTAGPSFLLETATQGKEGLEMLRGAVEKGAPFALAFVDVRMPPGWDGIQTIKRLWDEDQDLQVVICTAYADYSFDEIVDVLGSSDRLLILKKPFDPVEVRQLAVALTEKWNLIRSDRERMMELHQAEQQLRERASELESANKLLEEANLRAQAANQAKSEFLANMSHEIRTPMTGILGYGDLICDPTVPLEDRLKYGDIIRRSGTHLLTILNDILDISKIESGRMKLSIGEFSPVELVREVMQLMRTQADEKGLRFELEYSGPLPAKVESDQIRVRQVLINLVGNAIKFTEEGSVRFVVGTEPVPGTDRTFLRFDVADTGMGIDAEDLPTLFDAFSQADTSLTREVGGTGLGLAISKRLALMLGGSISVASEIGKGSTFTLRLDVGAIDASSLEDPGAAPAPPEESDRPARESTAQTLERRVLLVEDGAVNQLLISTVLKKAGADVEVADDGRAGCRAARVARDDGRPFDLILMDMQMPVMDGYEATRQLRNEGFTLPIIALTAHAMAGDRDKCIAAGCTDYATKPIDRQGLIATCRRLLHLEEADPALPSAEQPAPADPGDAA